MPSVSTIDELEAHLLAARDDAKRFLEEYETIDTKPSKGYVIAKPLAERVEQLSDHFHAPLVQLILLARGSPIFDDADLKAMRLAVQRIDAALSPLKYEHWTTTEFNNEVLPLLVRPADPTEVLAEIDHALDQVWPRLGILRAQAQADAAGERHHDPELTQTAQAQSETPKRGRPVDPVVQRRRAIVAQHMNAEEDWNDPNKLKVLREALDAESIPQAESRFEGKPDAAEKRKWKSLAKTQDSEYKRNFEILKRDWREGRQ